MPKILSIDFDIIMYPCIKLYNEHIGGSMNPTQIWKWLEEEKEIEPFLNYDAKILIILAKIIKNQMKKGAQLVCYNEHQESVDNLKTWDCFENEEPFDITNIDFHHDVWYREEDKDLLFSFNKYNCSNWLGYLFIKNKTSKIVWYKASNSDLPYENNIINEIYNISNLEQLNDETFDIIYFVKSPQWVHYKYHHLYDLISEVNKE